MHLADCDGAYRRALGAGATSLAEPTDKFYGDRACGVKDVGGNQWWIATRKEELSPQELQRRHEEHAGRAGRG